MRQLGRKLFMYMLVADLVFASLDFTVHAEETPDVAENVCEDVSTGDIQGEDFSEVSSNILVEKEESITEIDAADASSIDAVGTDAAESGEKSGVLGSKSGIKWTYNEQTKTLTVSGKDELCGSVIYKPNGYWVEKYLSAFEPVCEKYVVEKIEFKDCILSGKAAFMFYGLENLKEIDFSGIDTSAVTSMENMFAECSNLVDLDVTSFDTSQVTNMNGMFGWCDGLTSLDLSSFDTRKVTDMGWMFHFSHNLKSINFGNFNTSQVTNMQRMFGGCESLESLNLSSFDTSRVTDMGCMFQDCKSLKSLDVSNFNTSHASRMNGMFMGCSGLTQLNVDNFDTSSVKNMTSMFFDCSALQEMDLGNFNTTQTTHMDWMFKDCIKIEKINLSSFDTRSVIDMDEMFTGCSSLDILLTPKKMGDKKAELPAVFQDENGKKYTVLSTANVGKVLNSVKNSAKYTVFFKGNKAENGSMEEQIFEIGKAQNLTANTFTRKGYTFKAWNTKADGSGKTYKDKANVKNLTTKAGNKVNLYALWSANKYTVQLDGNGATSGNMRDLSKRAYGKKYVLPDNKYKLAGYTFVGWNTKEDGSGVSYKNKGNIKSLTDEAEGKVTLYAQWKLKEYDILYKLKGGENSESNPSSYNINTDTITLAEPAKKGYIFDGWYSNSKYKSTSKVTEIAKGSTGKRTLYAKWRENNYSISFLGNGATSGKMAVLKKCNYGESYNLTANKFARKGYTFVGWNTEKDGSGISYANESQVSLPDSTAGDSIKLYAQWTENQYNIVFDGNGNTNESVTMRSIRCGYSERVELPSNLFVNGNYIFSGWNTKANGSGKKYADRATITKLTVKNEATITLYAQWLSKESYNEAQVVKLVNKERKKAGLAPLSTFSKFNSVADVRAKEINIVLSHTRPNGTSFATAISEAGINYSRVGENIAWGYALPSGITPEKVMEGWMKSPGHRANILTPEFTNISVGYYIDGNGNEYWVQLFMRP